MSLTTATLVVPPSSSSSSSSSLFLCSASRRRPQTATVKTDKKQIQKNKVVFGGEKKELSWQCVEGCGACCKLQKGPSYPSPEEIFTDPSDVELYNSLIGEDGWCIHYEKSTRKCSIYSERPYFCRAEPEVFQSLFGVKEKNFNKEACSFCRDSIKSIYGYNSKELSNFDKSIRSSSS
ncbi:zinc/iron-chelating domain protein [Trifolium repens]|nr:zinc/iron-chelating domain protein [Trifolium repens]